jgi:hypothetical protein
VRDDCGTLLLQVGRELCLELPAPRADLGVLRRDLGYEISWDVLEHHHDLEK